VYSDSQAAVGVTFRYTVFIESIFDRAFQIILFNIVRYWVGVDIEGLC